MPLALLLQDVFRPLFRGVRDSAPLGRLPDLEAILLERARSYYMTRWFGAALPLDGLRLHVTIDNLDALRARFQAASRQTPRDERGPNLTEPLAGLFGMLAGAVLSPTGMILVSVALFVKRGVSIGWGILALLFGPALGSAVAGILIGLGTPLGLGVLPFVSDNPAVAGTVRLLGAFTVLLIAVTGFLNILTGPREGVRNPLLRSILEVFDRLANLLPLALQFVAFVVVRIEPVLRAQLGQIAPFRALIEASIGTGLAADGKPGGLIPFLLSDLNERLTHLKGALSASGRPAAYLMGRLMQIGTEIGLSLTRRLVGVLVTVGPRLIGGAGLAALAVGSWLLGVARELASAFGPMFRFFTALGTIFGLARRLLTTPSTPSPSTPSSGGGGLLPSLPPAPTFWRSRLALRIADLIAPPLQATPIFGPPAPPPPSTQAALDSLLSVPSVFSGERAALSARRAGLDTEHRDLPMATWLQARRQEEITITNALMAILNRVLPDEVAGQMPQLAPLFAQLDEKLYRMEPTASAPPPVRLPDDRVRLLPRINRVRLSWVGTPPSEGERPALDARLRSWGDDLRGRLRSQDYPTRTIPAEAR